MSQKTTHVHKGRADVNLALKELERLGVMVKAVFDDLLDRTHVSRLDIDRLLDLSECALAKTAISTATFLVTHDLSIWYRSYTSPTFPCPWLTSFWPLWVPTERKM